MGTPRSILIVNPFGIGDVLFTTPLVRAVRRAFPDSRIGYLCNRRTESLLRNNPNLDDLYVYERDEIVRMWHASRGLWLRHLVWFIRQILNARFDFVIDLSLSERYSFILRLLGVRRCVGFDFRHRGRFLSDRLTIDGYHDIHVVEYYRRLLWRLGILMDSGELECPLDEEDELWAADWLRQRRLEPGKLLIGMVPAGGVSWGIGAPFRRWTAEGFAEVGDLLADRYNADILLFGEPSDAAICAEVSTRMTRPVLNVSGQTTLGQFIALLKRLALVVCNDGGPLHLAVSQGTKTVSIFGPVDPRVYGPYPPRSSVHQVIYSSELRCRPCYHRFRLPPCPYERACLTSIEPADVFSGCEQVLGEAVLHG